MQDSVLSRCFLCFRSDRNDLVHSFYMSRLRLMYIWFAHICLRCRLNIGWGVRKSSTCILSASGICVVGGGGGSVFVHWLPHTLVMPARIDCDGILHRLRRLCWEETDVCN